MNAAAHAFSFGFTIEHGHPALPGHFPGRPVVPGVLLLAEVLAGVGAASDRGVRALKHVKFMAALLPDEAAVVDCEACGEEIHFAVRTARDGRWTRVAGGTLTLRSAAA